MNLAFGQGRILVHPLEVNSRTAKTRVQAPFTVRYRVQNEGCPGRLTPRSALVLGLAGDRETFQTIG